MEGKTDIFKAYKYDILKEPAEDYDLFTRLAAKGIQLANLEEPLLIYRVHTNQISKVQNQKQIYLKLKLTHHSLISYNLLHIFFFYHQVILELYFLNLR